MLGHYTGAVAIAAGPPEPLLVVRQQHGCVMPAILPGRVTPVVADTPVSVTRIASADTDAGHTVTFFTDTPVAGRVSQSGTVIELTFAPCRMAVLFEDAFFERVDFDQAGEAGIYTLTLPVGAAQTATLACHNDRMVLTLTPES
jgi:hypothetical protein